MPSSGTGKIGRYELEGELGRGGMAVVYRARDPALGRDVAIKVLPEDSSSEQRLRRFEREARTSAQLRHPSIVAVHEAGLHEGRPYLVMELVPGENLERALSRGLPLRHRVEIVRDVARALEHAHEHGVIHRDVKPGNVLVDREGRAHLTDFGLARSVSGSDRVTLAGEIVGTLAYMAPEQLAGEGDALGPACDVYSLGALLYRVLAGRPPFARAAAVSLMKSVLLDAPARPSELDPSVPRELEEVALRCLAKKPDGRYARAEDVALELDRFLEAGPATVAGTRPGSKGIAFALALVLLAGGGAAILASSGEPGPAPAPEAPRGTTSAPGRERPRATAAAVASSTARSDALDLAKRARERREEGDSGGAISLCTQAIELDPSCASAFWVRSLARSTQGDGEGAFADASRAIELEPSNAACWLARGQARKHRGESAANLDAEVADASRAIELEPSLEKAWILRGQARVRKHENDLAIADFTRAIELDAQDASAWTNRGLARKGADDVEGAEADQTRAIELAPEKDYVWFNRSLVRARKLDYDGAIADLTRALEIAPRDGEYWYSRGFCHYRKGDFPKAIADFNRSLELASRPLTLKSRGAARALNGNSEGARADYERFLEIYPNDPLAPEVRRSLAELGKAPRSP